MLEVFKRGLTTWCFRFLHDCLAHLGPPSCLYRTYHTFIFARVSLLFFSDFNLADYDYLPVSSEIKELFEYIKR